MEIRVFYERKRKSVLEGDISRVSFPISKKNENEREGEKQRKRRVLGEGLRKKMTSSRFLRCVPLLYRLSTDLSVIRRLH